MPAPASLLQVLWLEVEGFKSFRDRTHIPVSPGLTCIVGINGCGKSNLLDAFCFALGIGGTGGAALRCRRLGELVNTQSKDATTSISVRLSEADGSSCDVTATRRASAPQRIELSRGNAAPRRTSLKDYHTLLAQHGLHADFPERIVVLQLQTQQLLGAGEASLLRHLDTLSGAAAVAGLATDTERELGTARDTCTRLQDALQCIAPDVRRASSALQQQREVLRRQQCLEASARRLAQRAACLCLARLKGTASALGVRREELAERTALRQRLYAEAEGKGVAVLGLQRGGTQRRLATAKAVQQLKAFLRRANGLRSAARLAEDFMRSTAQRASAVDDELRHTPQQGEGPPPLPPPRPACPHRSLLAEVSAARAAVAAAVREGEAAAAPGARQGEAAPALPAAALPQGAELLVPLASVAFPQQPQGLLLALLLLPAAAPCGVAAVPSMQAARAVAAALRRRKALPLTCCVRGSVLPPGVYLRQQQQQQQQGGAAVSGFLTAALRLAQLELEGGASPEPRASDVVAHANRHLPEGLRLVCGSDAVLRVGGPAVAALPADAHNAPQGVPLWVCHEGGATAACGAGEYRYTPPQPHQQHPTPAATPPPRRAAAAAARQRQLRLQGIAQAHSAAVPALASLLREEAAGGGGAVCTAEAICAALSAAEAAAPPPPPPPPAPPCASTARRTHLEGAKASLARSAAARLATLRQEVARVVPPALPDHDEATPRPTCPLEACRALAGRATSALAAREAALRAAASAARAAGREHDARAAEANDALSLLRADLRAAALAEEGVNAEVRQLEAQAATLQRRAEEHRGMLRRMGLPEVPCSEAAVPQPCEAALHAERECLQAERASIQDAAAQLQADLPACATSVARHDAMAAELRSSEAAARALELRRDDLWGKRQALLADCIDRANHNLDSVAVRLARARFQPVRCRLAYSGGGVQVLTRLPASQCYVPPARLSGGQRALVATVVTFALNELYPSPLYLLDEVDAALDAEHGAGLAAMLREGAVPTLCVSLRQEMVAAASHVIGVYHCRGASVLAVRSFGPSDRPAVSSSHAAPCGPRL